VDFREWDSIVVGVNADALSKFVTKKKEFLA
jgi:hypothetical protein